MTLIILAVLLFWYLVSLPYGSDGHLLRIVELMMDPGAFVDSDIYEGNRKMPIFMAWAITISGAVLFTAMTITILGNIVGNRVSDFKKGLVRYDFDDHILIIGANSMLINMLKEIASDKILRKKRVVVLTKRDTELLQDTVRVKIPLQYRGLDLTFMFGHREVEETLRYVQVEQAHSIYILGEDDEIDHDSKSIQCWNIIKKLSVERPNFIQCYMVVDRMSSFHVYQYNDDSDSKNIRLTVINSLENWAQRVLVAREYEPDIKYPSIIGKDSEDYNKNVRFVVFGMTQMAYAMATTVAHIVHKPHFKHGPGARRTKITFIMPDIQQEMDFFRGHYESLFKLSHSTYWKYDETQKLWVDHKTVPNPDYGDFLDVEWEFVDGSIESGPVRELLCKYAKNDDEYLSIAICNHRTDENISASLYLPGEIYNSNVPVFVYQPNEGNVLKVANTTSKYMNVFPFGMKNDCYDPLFKRRLDGAKRIKYLYTLQDSGRMYMGMPSSEELDSLWNGLTSYALMYSNVYAASSIPIKLQLLGLDPDNLECITSFSESEVETLAEMEHNRWNIEKLLMGFSALDLNTRAKLKRDLCSNDETVRAQAKEKNKQYKNVEFKHKDITPYDDLLEGSKNYDKAIVRSIADVQRARL